MKTTKYTVGLFDLYGTLAGFNPPRETIQIQAAAKYGLKLTRRGVDRGYAMADKLLAEQNAMRPVGSLSLAKQKSFFTRYERLVLSGDNHTPDDRMALEVWRVVRNSRARLSLFPDVIPALSNMRLHGIVCGVVSNVNRSEASVSAEVGLVGKVDFMLTSGDAGVSKPDPRIFELALRRAGGTPQKAFYAGDQVEMDVCAAENAGLLGILIDRWNIHPHHADHPRFTDLHGLTEWLGLKA